VLNDLKAKLDQYGPKPVMFWCVFVMTVLNFFTLPRNYVKRPEVSDVVNASDVEAADILAGLSGSLAAGKLLTDDDATSRLAALDVHWRDERVQAAVIMHAWFLSGQIRSRKERAPQDDIRRAVRQFVGFHYLEAADEFRALLALFPGDPDVRNNYGLSLVMLGRMPEAQLHLEALRFAFPEHVPGLLNLAFVHIMGNRRAVFDDLMVRIQSIPGKEATVESDVCLYNRRWLQVTPEGIIHDIKRLKEAMDAFYDIRIREPRMRRNERLYSWYSYVSRYRDTGYGIAVVQQYYDEWEAILRHRQFLDVGAGIQLELVWIPEGTFPMGAPATEPGWNSNESPVHRVTLNGFWMGKYEVTQAQWGAVMGDYPSKFRNSQGPVENVKWDSAMEFCRRLSLKTGEAISLPTEAQWEYACRAGSTTRYCFGDSDHDLGEYAWYDANSGKRTQSVGQNRPNAFGVHDMHGNVWEWCLDWYDGEFYGKPEASGSNPVNQNPGEFRVLRGGSWGDTPENCRSAKRRELPGFAWNFLGFRVVCNTGESL